MDYFIHLPEFRIIICKRCKYAVLPSHIDAHFAAKPHNADKKERQRVIKEVAEINELQGNEETLRRSDFTFPPATAKPIAALGRPVTDGLQCITCQYVCCTLRGMQIHQKDEHEWKMQDKRGRPKKRVNHRSTEVPWRTNVHCQRFFTQGYKSGYFEVQKPESAPRADQQPGIASRASQYETARQELDAALRRAEAEERRVIKEAEEAREPNPWLRRVGWAAHLAGLDRTEIRTWIETPDEEEPELEILCKAFDWMIQSAQLTTVQEVISQAALFEANRKEISIEPQMPFDSWMDITTIRSYTRVWRQLLCYIFRAEDEEVRNRPAYKLTGRQQIGVEDVRTSIREFQEWQREQPMTNEDKEESDEEIEFMKRIQRKILKLCIALLNHPLQDNEYQNVIISGLAIMGIRSDDGWIDADDYTPKYSAVIKLARLMVVREGYEQRQEAIQRLEERGSSPEDASEEAKSYFYFIRRLTHQFMTMSHNGQDPTPMQWIFKARSYGFKIRYTTTAEGCIQWIGDTILYQQVRFDMSQVRSMVHGLVEEARDVLFSRLMKVDMDAERQVDPQQVPPIYWDSMVDNPSESRVGWSFFDDERNKFEVDGQWWLYERMYKEQRLREQFIDGGDATGKVGEEAAEAYQRQVERFRELLLILMHISGGQSARAPELLGIRWKNTEQGGVRNIFIENGLVAFVTTYHKGYRSSGNIKIIHRYLPREIGELLVYYLWLVRPFQEKLQFQISGKPCQSPFVWGDSKKIEHRRWTGPKKYRDSIDEEIETPQWTSERMRHIMQQASMRWMGVNVHISGWRQMSIAMSRRYCREHSFSNPESSQEGDGWEEEEVDQDNPWDLQSGHGTHVAGMIYARELMEGGNAVIGRREKFRQVSTTWHKFLQFGSAYVESGSGGKRKRGTDEDDMQEVRQARWKRLREVDIHQELKHMLGEQAQFRGLQEPVLKSIMRGESPILVVMGTGAGKSLLFQLPAHSQKSGTTVVIIPLKSLEKSLHERCQKAGISCIQWDPHQSDRMAQVVLVQPESAVSAKFAQYLNRLEGLGQLDRIIFDETHTVLDSQPDFRPKMKEAGGVMIKRGVQIIYLSATLPPSDEREFFQIMKVQIPAQQVFRTPTSRPNIAYSVKEYDTGVEEITAVQELVARKLEQYPAPAKIIIYGSSIDAIEEIGTALGCHIYHAGIGSPEIKSRIQERWERADGRVVVASNAFGLGIDRPDVRAVIHVGAIFKMRDYGQESGRAGRDGQASEAIIIVGAGKQEALQRHHERLRRQPAVHRAVITEADRKRVAQEKVDRFISGAQCRRIHLDQEMDGRTDRERCEEGEEACDICQKGNAMMKEADTLQRAYMVEQEEKEGHRPEPMFDSGIDISSSQGICQPSSPSAAIRSSPPRGFFTDPATNASSSPGDRIPSSVGLPSLRRVGNTAWSSPASSSPASSMVSSDRAFTTDIADGMEFRRQQSQQKQDQAYAQSHMQGESQAVWELEQQLEEWVGRCPVCFIRGFGKSQHSIIDCVEDGAQEVRDEWMRMRKRMREGRLFAGYSCCYDCHVPQAICGKWIGRENGKWRSIAERKCQFEGIIMPLVISGIVEGEEHTYDVIKDWIEGSGVELGNWEEVYRWLGQKEEWGGIEVSRLVQVFYRMVKGL